MTLVLVLAPNTPGTFGVLVTSGSQLPLVLGSSLTVVNGTGLQPNTPGTLTLTPNT